MNLELAEKFFKKYDGFHFHMGREEMGQYNEYRSIKIDQSVEDKWRIDLIEKYSDGLFDNEDEVWVKHSKIIEIMLCMKENCQKYKDMLLQQMVKMSELDEFQKTLILENMAGRTIDIRKSGCYLLKPTRQLIEAIGMFTCQDKKLEERRKTAYQRICTIINE